MSFWLVRSGTVKLQKLPFRPHSPATWSSQPCTPMTPSAITRLIDMGVKPFLVASSIQAIMAQRLVRVLCKHCKAPQDHDPKELQLIGIDPDSPEVDQIMGPVGCPKCENIGFKGRRAIFEFMKMNSEVRDLAFQRAPAEEIRAVAIRTGMRTLVDDGRLKTLAGSTTPAEVARFAQAEFLTSETSTFNTSTIFVISLKATYVHHPDRPSA